MPKDWTDEHLAPADPTRWSESQREALSAILTAAQDGKSFVALTGEARTGKTAMLNTAATLLDQPPVQVIRIDAGDEPLTLRRLIAGISGADAEVDPAAAIEHAMDRLLRPTPPCSRTILMVDDAHALEQGALQYLHLTDALRLQDAACLQIVFAGRPHFWSLLDTVRLGGLRERIGFRAVLEKPRETSLEAHGATPSLAPTGLPANEASCDLIPLRPSQKRARRYAIGFGLAVGISAAMLLVTMNPAVRDAALAQVLTIRTWFRAQQPGTPVGATRFASAGPPSALHRTSNPSATVGAGPTSDPAPPAESRPSVQASASRAPETAATGQSSPNALRDGDSTPTASSPPLAHAATAGPGPPSPEPAPPILPVLPTPAAFAQPIVPLSVPLVASLLTHGDEMLRLGDIGAARLLYRRAAEAGNAAAAVAMGKTYDPRFLAQIGAQRIAPDPAAAADWYRRAAALGDNAAESLLAGLARR